MYYIILNRTICCTIHLVMCIKSIYILKIKLEKSDRKHIVGRYATKHPGQPDKHTKLEKRLSRLPFTIFSTRSRWWRCLAPLNFFNSSILFPRVTFLLLANNAFVTDEAVVFVADSFILTFMSFLVRDCTSSSIFVAGCFTIRNASGWLVCCWCCNGYRSGRLLPAIVKKALRAIVVTTAMLLVGWGWWLFCCCCLGRCFNADQRRGIAVGIINGWCLFNFPSSNWEIHTIFWLHRW